MTDSLELVEVRTNRCPRCGLTGKVKVPKINYDKWKSPPFPFIQDAFPNTPPDIREQLLTGYHGECFDLDFPEEEEEGGCSTDPHEDDES